MSPAQVSYVVDVVLGIIVAGAIAAGNQYLAGGAVDTRVLIYAFIGGAMFFARKWLSVNYGADSVAVPKVPGAYPTTPAPDPPPEVPPAH